MGPFRRGSGLQARGSLGDAAADDPTLICFSLYLSQGTQLLPSFIVHARGTKEEPDSKAETID